MGSEVRRAMISCPEMSILSFPFLYSLVAGQVLRRGGAEYEWNTRRLRNGCFRNTVCPLTSVTVARPDDAQLPFSAALGPNDNDGELNYIPDIFRVGCRGFYGRIGQLHDI